MVGQYHVARLIPVFVLSLAQMLQATLLPYLCHDWELGHREKVNARLDSFLRLFGLAFFTAAALFLAVGPWLLTHLFGDKYEAGLAILNLTLMHGVFASLFVITQTYLWCDEKGWLVNLGLLIALLVNTGLNLLLLPRFGLQGAAIASCVGTVILLLYVISISWFRGMRFRVATGIVAVLPLSFLAGAYVGVIVLGGTIVVALSSDILLTQEDKKQATEFAQRIGDFANRRRS
jgi:O-antigen/teichoic acid export membrane protein